MGVETFLILLTLCTAFVKKSETAPALLVTTMAYILYAISLTVLNPLYLLVIAGAMEALTVALLVCLKGCLRSTLVSFMIPISISLMGIHFIGWCMLYNGMEMSLYNEFVDVYWVVILGLFLSVSRWMNGNYIRFIRLFRKHDSQSGII
jgi:hypothetical protein